MSFSMKVENYDELAKEVTHQTELESVEKAKMKSMAEINVDKLESMDINMVKNRYEVMREIEDFGIESLRKSSEKNQLLQRSIHAISSENSSSNEVMEGIEQLKYHMKSLNPNQIAEPKRGLFGKLINPATAYFDKYKKVDNIMDSIIDSLDEGKERLKNDNTALEIEVLSLKKITKHLSEEIELGMRMDKELGDNLDNMKISSSDGGDVEFIEQEVVFPLRQRIIDLQQMLIVNRQGILAIEVIRRNNNELIRGVDRAKYVTVSALRIATMVANALYDQNLVLKQITELNSSTSEFIEATSRLIKTQGIEISKQSSEAYISLETLKNAYDETMESLEIMDNYKKESLPKMKEIIVDFEQIRKSSQIHIDNIEKLHG